MKTEEIPIISSTEPIKITNKLFEHTNEIIISTESIPMIEENNQTSREDESSSSTFTSSSYFDETTLEEQTNSSESYTTINEEQTHLTSVSTTEELSTVSITTNPTRLFHLLANLTPEHTVIQIRNYTIISDNPTTSQ
jgi:hypothetical protein